MRGTPPAKGTYRPGIGRTSIIQEVSAAAPLRIPCDVFNGESAAAVAAMAAATATVAGALINVCVLMQKVPVTRAHRQRGLLMRNCQLVSKRRDLASGALRMAVSFV